MSRRPSLLQSWKIQRRVVWALTLREILTRYGRHNIGFLWLFAEPMRSQPFGFANLLTAVDFHAGGPREIALVGDPNTPQMAELLAQVRSTYVPNRTLSVTLSDAELTKRREQWKPRDPKYKRGVMAKYANTVTSASKGATTT